jgi:glycyl-tRNA synthetase beta chain
VVGVQAGVADGRDRGQARLGARGAGLDGLLQRSDYPAALKRLAQLRPALDRFFDEVMVMTDDATLKRNRLALLHRLRRLFLRIADVARLGRA